MSFVLAGIVLLGLPGSSGALAAQQSDGPIEFTGHAAFHLRRSSASEGLVKPGDRLQIDGADVRILASTARMRMDPALGTYDGEIRLSFSYEKEGRCAHRVTDVTVLSGTFDVERLRGRRLQERVISGGSLRYTRMVEDGGGEAAGTCLRDDDYRHDSMGHGFLTDQPDLSVRDGDVLLEGRVLLLYTIFWGDIPNGRQLRESGGDLDAFRSEHLLAGLAAPGGPTDGRPLVVEVLAEGTDEPLHDVPVEVRRIRGDELVARRTTGRDGRTAPFRVPVSTESASTGDLRVVAGFSEAERRRPAGFGTEKVFAYRQRWSDVPPELLRPSEQPRQYAVWLQRDGPRPGDVVHVGDREDGACPGESSAEPWLATAVPGAGGRTSAIFHDQFYHEEAVEVHPGQKIQTPLDGFVRIGLGAAEVDLEPNSLLQLPCPGRAAPRIRFENGRLIAENEKGEEFEVQTRSIVVGTRGTRFLVRASGDATDVAVFEGTVEVTPTNTALAPFLLEAGQQVTITLTAVGSITVAGPAPPRRDDGGAGRVRKPGSGGGPTGEGDGGRTLEADRRAVRSGQVTRIYVRLRNPAGVANMNYELRYDPAVVRPEGEPLAGNLLRGEAVFEANPAQPGRIRIGFAGAEGLDRDGTLAAIPFRATGPPGSRTALTLVTPVTEDSGGGALPIARLDGAIEVLPEGGGGPGDGRGGDPRRGGGDRPGGGPGGGGGDEPGDPAGDPAAGRLPDCNGDGRLTALDADCALEMSVGKRPADSGMDADGDGRVTSGDARTILQRARGSGR